MDFESIKRYWDDRAASDETAQSTTQDFYLREIEFKVIQDVINRFMPVRVMDIGCGDARTTAKLATNFPNMEFWGYDYSTKMIHNASKIIRKAELTNLHINVGDVCHSLPMKNMDLVYSTRCLINLPSVEQQQVAINNIFNVLSVNGIYLMIENFIEGHNNFNRIREAFGLPIIPIRCHNLYFSRKELINFIGNKFEIIDEVNISSMYYLVSRVIYTQLCKDDGLNPDYFNSHHKYAAELPFCGEFGPIRMICMKRKFNG